MNPTWATTHLTFSGVAPFSMYSLGLSQDILLWARCSSGGDGLYICVAKQNKIEEKKRVNYIKKKKKKNHNRTPINDTCMTTSRGANRGVWGTKKAPGRGKLSREKCNNNTHSTGRTPV